MGIVNNALAGASGNQGYNLQRSLRFRSSASAYLSRTPASTTNQQTFTLSFWTKRGTLGSDTTMFSFGNGGGTGLTFEVYFGNSGQGSIVARTLNIGVGSTWVLQSSGFYRDPSAWYHVVVAVDTTQATDTNRVKIYINGVQLTSFSTATYPTLNYNTGANTNTQHRIGVRADTTQYYDGYQAEINFIDGQALTPSSFGQTSTTTGVWQPKKYTGTYGTNGFYLPFTDNSALTTSSNAGLGKDFSGNSNYWVTNNISISAGSTYDSMTDVPTLTSATAANFAVINPLSTKNTPTIQSGNLDFVGAGTASYRIATGTQGTSSGKWYWEATINTAPATGENASVGITSKSYAGDITNSYLGNQATEWGLLLDSGPSNYGKSHSTITYYGTAVTNGDVVQIAYDIDAGKIWFGLNGTWFASGNPATGANAAYTDLVAGTVYYPAVDMLAASPKTFSVNFGQRPFTYTPPTGYVALNTYNLPTPTIGATSSTLANKYMDATTYTGNGSTQTITNSGGFQPDFVWIKCRSYATGHNLQDAVRGSNLVLYSNGTNAEINRSPYGVTSINSNGFTVADTSLGDYGFNGPPGGTYSGAAGAYVGWQWNAGGSNATNTSGSITSTVRANPSCGFSIVTYTGTGANATVGHGLGVAPSMVIVKRRSAAEAWGVYHKSLGATQAINLELTAAAYTYAIAWNNTAPTSSTFSLGTWAAVNSSAGTFVAYCFSEVAGFSKFGSYTGNGSADGPFVYCGFRPKYFLIKRTDTTSDWFIWDSVRSSYNLGNLELYAELSNAEATNAGGGFDLLSNGLKIRVGSGYNPNVSGGTYIFMAFAENPYKYSLAR